MIKPRDYNCREMQECYLAYRRRIHEEQRLFEEQRPLRQSNEEWIAEYTRVSNEIDRTRKRIR